MPDGERFAVANGGLETDPTSGRTNLNVATMESNLAYIDAASGEILDVLSLPEPLRLLSIRHIAAGQDGTLAAAMQWQGSETDTPPLLTVHRPGATELALFSAEPGLQRRLRNYAGSVAVSDDGRLAALTAPQGRADAGLRPRDRRDRGGGRRRRHLRRRPGRLRLRLLDRRGPLPDPRPRRLRGRRRCGCRISPSTTT